MFTTEQFILIGFIFCAHFIGDYVLQPRWMGDKKHKDESILFLHGTVYSITLMIFLLFTFTVPQILILGILNGVLHVVVDAVTSNLSHYFYGQERYKMFFIVIGIDDLIHLYTIFATIIIFS